MSTSLMMSSSLLILSLSSFIEGFAVDLRAFPKYRVLERKQVYINNFLHGCHRTRKTLKAYKKIRENLEKSGGKDEKYIHVFYEKQVY